MIDLILKEIPLTQGQVALVLEDDYDELNEHKWYALWSPNPRTFYAVRNGLKIKGEKRLHFTMHRVILNAPKGVQVDHRDGNGLHNYPPNIRLTSASGNCRNIGIPRHNNSGYKGVSWETESKKWLAGINITLTGSKKRHINLGRYMNILDAARAYNAAALKYHGEFACLNVILDDLMCCC